jgi:hypothetical protein
VALTPPKMTEPFSIATGVAGIITLSSAVVAAGYKYFNSVRSASTEMKDLIREIAFMHMLVSKYATQSLSACNPYSPFISLVDQEIFDDCHDVLRRVQKHLDHSLFMDGSHEKNVFKHLLWPLKRDDIVRGRERISRLCAILNTATTIDNANSLEKLLEMQELGLKHTQQLASNSHDIEERKILDWLSMYNPRAKHSATKILQQPGTSDWLLQEQTITAWIDQGGFLWLNGSCGIGKSVLV